MNNFQYHYNIISIIYSGINSIVYKVYNRINHTFYACKRITILEDNIEKINNEIFIMELIKYDDDFIKLHEYFIDIFYYYIIFELAYGNILDYIKQNVIFENDIKNIFLQILCSIKKLHEKNIIHLDIKPDNILYIIKDDKIKVKISDFGNSVYNYNNYVKNIFINYTPEYSSPELFNNVINCRNDVYSIGYSLYKLLMEEINYTNINNNSLFNKKKHLYQFHKNWDKISFDAKDLINQMINHRHNLRPNINKCLKHKWFNNYK